MFCQKAFTAEGDVELADANIGGELSFYDATLKRPDGEPGQLDLRHTQARDLRLPQGRRPDRRGVVILVHARVDRLHDVWDPAASPYQYRPMLAGFVYESLGLGSDDVAARLDWLSSAEGYVPHAYDQLAAVLRRAGREEDARAVAIAKQRQRRKELRRPARWWNGFLGMTVGHGYRLWLAGLWLVGLLIVGSLLFGVVYDKDDGDLTPAKEEPASYNPVIYTMDLLVTVISLGQRVSWNAHNSAQWVATALTVCGWLLTAALIAGIAARRQ
jgi:hypothetical protein